MCTTWPLAKLGVGGSTPKSADWTHAPPGGATAAVVGGSVVGEGGGTTGLRCGTGVVAGKGPMAQPVMAPTVATGPVVMKSPRTSAAAAAVAAAAALAA